MFLSKLKKCPGKDEKQFVSEGWEGLLTKQQLPPGIRTLTNKRTMRKGISRHLLSDKVLPSKANAVLMCGYVSMDSNHHQKPTMTASSIDSTPSSGIFHNSFTLAQSINQGLKLLEDRHFRKTRQETSAMFFKAVNSKSAQVRRIYEGKISRGSLYEYLFGQRAKSTHTRHPIQHKRV